MKKEKANAVFKLVLSSFMVFSCLPIDGVTNVVKANENNLKEILYMNFDEENFQDLSGSNNHGTEVGEVDFVRGVCGKAAHIVNDTGKQFRIREELY